MGSGREKSGREPLRFSARTKGELRLRAGVGLAGSGGAGRAGRRRHLDAAAAAAPARPAGRGRRRRRRGERGGRRALPHVPGAAPERAARAMAEHGGPGIPNGECAARRPGNRVTVVLGAQWGDEGKGKVVDLLAQDADIVCRCQVRRRRRRREASGARGGRECHLEAGGPAGRLWPPRFCLCQGRGRRGLRGSGAFPGQSPAPGSAALPRLLCPGVGEEQEEEEGSRLAAQRWPRQAECAWGRVLPPSPQASRSLCRGRRAGAALGAPAASPGPVPEPGSPRLWRGALPARPGAKPAATCGCTWGTPPVRHNSAVLSQN